MYKIQKQSIIIKFTIQIHYFQTFLQTPVLYGRTTAFIIFADINILL